MVLLVLLLLVLPVFVLLSLQKYSKNGKPQLPPGPPPLPIIGNLHQMDISAPHRQLWKLSRTYGPLMFLKLGHVPVLVVSSAEMAKEILKTHDLIFAGRPSFLGVKKLSYNCVDIVFAPYGDYWREMRKICVNNLFSTKSVQSFNPIRKDEVSRMIGKISESTLNSKVINLSEMLITLVSTIVCRVAFSKRYDDGGYERSKYQSLLHEIQALSTSFFLKDYFPLAGWVDNLSGLNRRLEKSFKELDSFLQEHIDDHLDPKRKKGDQEDFIDVLLSLREDTSFTIDDLNFDHIKAVLMDVFVAGTDTSAATTVWAMTGLIKNPIAMKRVQEEVRKTIGNKGFVEEDDIPNLPYLNAVIKETMRLFPPAPLLVPHESTQTCTIGGYEIPARTLVQVNVWAIGRDPISWKDSEEFLPERFMGSSIDFRGRDFELIPFGAGRRGCPGLYMGIVAVEIALANLLYSFDWELPAGVQKEDIDTDTAPGTTMHKKNALCLIAKRVTHED